jgi:hypothetical protein
MTSRRSQQGQAIIVGLLTLAIAAGTLFFLFNSGQLLREKTTATNAADAAAISGASVMARVMNFEAYTNRAVMANTVAIGQLTALASWDQYALSIGYSYSQSTPAPSSIGSLFCLTRDGVTALPCTYGGNQILEYYTGVNVFDYYANYFSPYFQYTLIGMSFVANAANQVALQTPGLKDVLLITMPIARQQAIEDAVDRNYDGFGPAQGRSVIAEDTFFSFGGVGSPMIRRHRDDERERLRATVQTAAEGDSFVRARRFDRDSLVPTCIGTNGVRFDRLRRGGGTLARMDEWEAIDTSSWHETYLSKSRCRTSENPLGYGQAEAGSSDGLSTEDMGGSGHNPQAADDSSSYSNTDLVYSGLPSFYELSPNALEQERPAARFAVRVNREQSDLRLPNRGATARAGGRLNQMGVAGGRAMAALSSAEVFFERLSDRADGRTELASLFNPFWHVRLAPPGAPAIAEAIATQ